MSEPIPAIDPQVDDYPQLPPEPYTYDFIPKLKQLLPKTGGVPGVEYLQCAAANAYKAQSEGWKQVHGSQVYQIRNPWTGERTAMSLLAQGTPLKGLPYHSGIRECSVDIAVEQNLGLADPETGKFLPPGSTPETPEPPPDPDSHKKAVAAAEPKPTPEPKPKVEVKAPAKPKTSTPEPTPEAVPSVEA